MLTHSTAGLLKATTFGLIFSFGHNGYSQELLDLRPPAFTSEDPEGRANEDIRPEPSDDDLGVEAMTRGPLHEAFAEPIVSDPEPGFVVNREPPTEINEMAPEFKPEGEDAIWISGYWGWDEQRDDFIWISGVYRVPPEGHRWVPGYWHQVSDGWQWVQGFWVEDMAESINYLPPPPITLENGPSSPSPGSDYFYIPGNWSQSSSSSNYLWNVGYWHPMQDDLIWVPSHNVWTPRGCVFVKGYWDQRLPLRGFCFAPVYIPRATYSRPGWIWHPTVVLNSQVVLHNLFVQPGYNHYLFGDYYGLPNSNRRVVPAYLYHQRRGSCDPLISFYSAYNARQGQDMIRWYSNQHANLRLNPSSRPPQVWTQPSVRLNDKSLTPINAQSQIAFKLDQVNKVDGGPRIAPISASFKQDMLKQDVDRKRLAKDREAIEGKGKIPTSIAIAGVAAPALTLPKLDNSFRKDESASKRSKVPEQPRNANRERSNPTLNDTANKLPGELNSRRLDSNKMESTRPGKVRIDSIPKNPSSNPQVTLPNQTTPLNNHNLVPQKLGIEQPNQPNQSIRVESNRISNPLDTKRVLEKLKQSEPSKITIPKIQSQLPTNPSPPTNFQPQLPVQPRLPNIQLQGNKGQLQGNSGQLQGNDGQSRRYEERSSRTGNLRGGTNSGPSTQPNGPPVQSQPKLQNKNPSNPQVPPQADRQPRLGNTKSNGEGNSDKGDRSKKQK